MQQQGEKQQHQCLNRYNKKQDLENNKKKQQSEKVENRDKGKRVATSTPVSTPKSKIKTSKQKKGCF